MVIRYKFDASVGDASQGKHNCIGGGGCNSDCFTSCMHKISDVPRLVAVRQRYRNLLSTGKSVNSPVG